MTLAARLERRWLGLPAARSSVLESDVWMQAPDGARLVTRVLRPTDTAVRRGTVLVRSERPPGGRSSLEKLCRWLAEDGRCVVLQSCRGRGASEGSFRPFLDEVADGGAALRWLRDADTARALGLDGELVLLGLGYSAFAAWAALAAEPGAACAIATGFGARDPYAWLHRGGVLQLEAALALAARLDGRRGHDPAELDLARAAHQRRLADCDRTAIRELAAFQDWLAHPARDDWWSERTPPLPERTPPALLLAGWYECAQSAVVSDYTELAERAASSGVPPPSLRIGPWSPAPPARSGRLSRAGASAASGAADAVLRFVARALGVESAREAPVRVFVRGAGWRDAERWPPETARSRTHYLRSDGRANTLDGDGRLTPEPPGAESADRFVADPADPVPSLGGVSHGSAAGPLDRQAVEHRGDVLCFTSAPQTSAMEIAGHVRLRLYAERSETPADFCAVLAAVEPSGAARWLAEGIARSAADGAEPLDVDLGCVAALLAAGTRLRLELAGSSLPRFARPDADGEPAAQSHARPRVVHHDAARPSSLSFEVLDANGPTGSHRRARRDSAHTV